MNNKRIIYIAVLVIAVVVLIWDKSTQTSDESSLPIQSGRKVVPQNRVVPSNAPALAASTDSPKTNNDSMGILAELTVTLKQSLLRPIKSDSRPITKRDIFSASKDFLEAIDNSSGRDSDEANKIDYKSLLFLAGTVIGPDTRYAIINQQVLFPGQYIGRYRLEDVINNAVILKKPDDDQNIILFVDEYNPKAEK